jgi:hypothetical protein
MFAFSEFPRVQSNLNMLRFLFCACKFRKNVSPSLCSACSGISRIRNRVHAAENLRVFRLSYNALNMRKKLATGTHAEQVISAVTKLFFWSGRGLVRNTSYPGGIFVVFFIFA